MKNKLICQKSVLKFVNCQRKTFVGKVKKLSGKGWCLLLVTKGPGRLDTHYVKRGNNKYEQAKHKCAGVEQQEMEKGKFDGNIRNIIACRVKVKEVKVKLDIVEKQTEEISQ